MEIRSQFANGKFPHGTALEIVENDDIKHHGVQ
jgi:hypothetical protein